MSKSTRSAIASGGGSHLAEGRGPGPCTYEGGPAPILFTIPEAARTLRVSRAQTYRLINNGDLPVARLGGRVLVRSSDIDALITRAVDQSVAPPPPTHKRGKAVVSLSALFA